MILSGADNRLPMLDKDLYDSWKSRMKLYMQYREHRRMILESVEHGLLIWPTVEENGVTRTKKYVEISVAEKTQADCDMKATNIILQAFSRFSSTNNQLRTSLNLRIHATIQDGRVIVQQVQGRQGQSYSSIGYKSNATSFGGNNASGQARPKRPRNATWYKDKEMLAEAQEARQILDEEQLTFFADLGVPDGYAGNPNKNNGWIEADVPLHGELEVVADELMVGPIVDEIAKPIVNAKEQDTGMSLIAYADAGRAGCQDTRRSISGSAEFL
nr:hypothetical protein [Tanacetum cinerariifolium]